MRNVSHDQSATTIQSLLNTNGATFLMTSHVTSALWTLRKYARYLILKVRLTQKSVQKETALLGDIP